MKPSSYLKVTVNMSLIITQGCDEYSFTWGISEEVHEKTVGKREGLGRADFYLNSWEKRVAHESIHGDLQR